MCVCVCVGSVDGACVCVCVVGGDLRLPRLYLASL